MAKPKYWWIKERYNPQLGVYYVPCGNLSIKDAKRMEGSIYGTNYMKRYSSESAYNTAIDKLKAEGQNVR